jgi:hypothetical protein
LGIGRVVVGGYGFAFGFGVVLSVWGSILNLAVVFDFGFEERG